MFCLESDRNILRSSTRAQFSVFYDTFQSSFRQDKIDYFKPKAEKLLGSADAKYLIQHVKTDFVKGMATQEIEIQLILKETNMQPST